jgi:uncharacterized membrane protein YkvI
MILIVMIIIIIIMIMIKNNFDFDINHKIINIDQGMATHWHCGKCIYM